MADHRSGFPDPARILPIMKRWALSRTSSFDHQGAVFAVKDMPRRFRPQVRADQRLQCGQRLIEYVNPAAVHHFDDDKRFPAVLRDHGAPRVPPVETAADRAPVVLVHDLAGKGRIVLFRTDQAERLAAVRDAEAEIALECVPVLRAGRNPAGEGYRIVDIHQRVDGADILAFSSASMEERAPFLVLNAA